ncbi:hypothetical protein NUSPORA_02321 [Nucleospora cyclopteri]
MKNPEIAEGFIEINKIAPKKEEIYYNSSKFYSSLKTLSLKREYRISAPDGERYGIIPEMHSIWYTKESSLFLYNYSSCTTEEIKGFSTPLLFVELFKAPAGIFADEIKFCLFVCTNTDCIVYAIEQETQSLVNTDFFSKLPGAPTAVASHSSGYLMVGTSDGEVIKVTLKSFLGYKYLSLNSPLNILDRALKTIFRRKAERARDFSLGKKQAVVLGKNITVYNVETLRKEMETDGGIRYIKVQIVEEDPFFFYALTASGERDFFDQNMKKFPLKKFSMKSFFQSEPSFSEISPLVRSMKNKLICINKCNGISILSLCTLNGDQLVNFNASKPAENQEQTSVDSDVKAVHLSDSSLVLLSAGRISEYEIFSSKRLLLNCRTSETFQLYKSYGDIHFMIRYFELLAENENVSKIEPLVKSDSLREHALFCYVAQLLKPVWKEDLLKMHSTANEKFFLMTSSIRKLRNLQSKPKQGKRSYEFIDELIQTFYYTSLLSEYKISFRETLETLLTAENSLFRKNTLKSLLDIFSKNKSVDSFLKTLSNKCPLYLPSDEINVQRGMEMVRSGRTEQLREALKFFTDGNRVDLTVIEMYNKAKFYYGSVSIIKSGFSYSYETAVDLLKQCVKCPSSISCGLKDSRECFLYPFFESLVLIDKYEECSCCEFCTEKSPDLLNVENPLFVRFLSEKKSSNERIYNLLWKIYLTKGDKKSAVETLIGLSQRIDLPLEVKENFIKTALSISPSSTTVKKLLVLLGIQREMMQRKHLNINRVLSADSLLNDYCYDLYDLSLLILDITRFSDKKALRELYKKYFLQVKNFNEIFEFLSRLKNKNNTIHLFMEFLMEKERDQSIGICQRLFDTGFDYREIITNVKNQLMGNSHPRIKQVLLGDLKSFAKENEYEECRRYCEKIYGVVI